MKRPLLYFFVGILGALFLLYTSFKLTAIIAILVLLLFQIKLKNKKQKVIFSFFFIFVTVYFFFFSLDFKNEESDNLYGKTISGYVSEVKDYAVIIDDFCVGGKPYDFKILVYTKGEFELGDKVEGKLVRSKNKDYYNEGRFEFSTYLKSKKILAAYSSKLNKKSPKERYFIRRLLYSFRGKLEKKLKRNMGVNSEVLAAILLGVSAEVDLVFVKVSGLIHIFAISGLHLAIIAKIIYFLAKFISPDIRKKSMLTIVFILLYTILTGLHASTVRACVMISIFLFKNIFIRAYDRTSSLVAAFILMILINPFSLYSPGFIFSFSAVVGIFYTSEILPLARAKSEFLRNINIIIGVWLSMVPVLAYYYYTINIYSALANFLVVPVVGPLILSGILSLILPDFLSVLILDFTSFLIDYIMNFSKIIASLPYAEINIGAVSIFLIILYFIGIFSLKKKKFLGIFSLLALALILIIGQFGEEARIDFIDIGNGDAILFRDEGECMLIDGGGIPFKEGDNQGVKVLLPYLKYEGINKIDKVVISHSDFDHIYGIIEILGLVGMDEIILNDYYADKDGYLLDLLRERAMLFDVDIVYVKNEERLDFGSGNFVFYTPYKREDEINPNSASIMILGEFYDKRFLFLGDCEKDEEVYLLEEYDDMIRDVDLLKVAHHGSKTSSGEDFIREASPSLSLISVGRHNRFGHPNDEVLARLEASSDEVLMTSESGQITVFIDAKYLEYRTYLDE